jgi:ABC-2 type transport system ATP-binding protein
MTQSGERVLASIRDVKKSFRSVEALRGVSFDVQRGEVVGLLGPNGAGKSTTIGVLLGFLSATSGEVSLFGGSPHDAENRARVGYVPESPIFADHHHPESLLRFHAALLGVDSKERGDRASEVLKTAGLEGVGRRRVGTLSKGMLQRLALAVALMGEPELIVLDEPTSNLDPVGRRDVGNLIRAQRGLNRGVIFASHVLAEIEASCDRVLILSEGSICLAGTIRELCGEGDGQRSLESVFFEAVGHDEVS